MKLIGFNLTKINAEKTKGNLKDVKIETKLDVKEITLAKQEAFKMDDELLAVIFTYDLLYKEDVGKINLEGTLVLALDSKTKDEILEEWKSKKMPDEFKMTLFNIIIRKSAIKTLELEETMGLPHHIQFPVLKKQE